VRLEGLGLIMPDIDMQGNFVMRRKPDRKLRIDVTQRAEFYGKVINQASSVKHHPSGVRRHPSGVRHHPSGVIRHL